MPFRRDLSPEPADKIDAMPILQTVLHVQQNATADSFEQQALTLLVMSERSELVNHAAALAARAQVNATLAVKRAIEENAPRADQ